jgi:hypothetical protein
MSDALPHLHRYWFIFAADTTPRYCGVTAYTYEDALHLVRTRVFPRRDLPPITESIADVDIPSLDPKHVLPNIGPPNRRGVWFPMGFEERGGGAIVR